MAERVIRLPARMAQRAVLEVAIVEPLPAGRVRRWLARRLLILAGRLLRLRVRIVDQ